MQKVNEAKLLSDYNSLCEKSNGAIAAITADARAFALGRGYDEAKTAQFIDYVIKSENSGLASTEKAMFETLANYIYNVVDEEREAETETTTEG